MDLGGVKPVVPNAWRHQQVLVPAEVEISFGEVLLLDDMTLRRDLRLKLSSLLLELGIEHLDMDEIQGKNRALTQAITCVLFEKEAAGILYRSRCDNELCGALFEGRARLLPCGEPRSLADPLPELEQVCREFDLSLEPEP